jgi:WD40 repeat protein
MGELRSFAGHTAPITCVAFSPNGRVAVAGSADQTIRMWEIDTGKHHRLFEGHTRPVMSVAWLNYGGEVLSAGEDLTVRRWHTETGKEFRSFAGWAHRCVAFCAVQGEHHRYALSGSPYDGMIRLYDLNTGREVRRLKGHASFVWSVAFSPDGRRAVSGSGEMKEDKGKWQPVDCTVRVWDLETGREVRRFEGPAESVRSVAYSPDGRHVAAGSRDSIIRLWDTASGQLRYQWENGQTDFPSLAFSLDGRRLLGGGHTAMWLWDVATGKEVWKVVAPKHLPEGYLETIEFQVAISPDGRFALSGGRDRLVRLWKLPE